MNSNRKRDEIIKLYMIVKNISDVIFCSGFKMNSCFILTTGYIFIHINQM